ncbi:MAG: efflux RND transporter permease subunit [Deltaproteobacteria bacterium]|nr:efflux RND transporter permease subunit [Deltaproteobacteria bacterium]
MPLTDLFIRRPVLALVVSLAIVIAGLQAVRRINVRQYPRSENAAVTVTTVYVGASADLVRGFITTPLERVIAAADGIDYIESESKLGLSTIRARLRLDYDSTRALAEISAKVDQVRRDLPPEAEIPTIDIESAESQFAAAYLSFSSDKLKQNEITDYLLRVVQPRLSALDGVQRADILGARTIAMRIWLKPERMAALNVSPAQVRAALEANNYLAAVGQTKGSLVQVNLSTNTDLRSVPEFKRLIVRERDGAIVRLGDIAEVVLGAEDYDSAVSFTGQTAVFIGVWALPNANSLDVIQRVRGEMASLAKEIPEELKAVVAYDATAYIHDAISEVESTLGDTLLIVVLVIFLFLGSLRSVLVPVVAIPVSLIGGVFLMQVFGFTLNLLTLLAIVLSVGLVVDDAIVVVENVERHVREGLSPVDAALKGARELVGPLVAMSVTLAAVYAPIAFQGGLTGSLFKEFALTLAGAVMISGVVALTLSPVMSAYLLRGKKKPGRLAGFVERILERLKERYSRSLEASFRARGAIYLVWVVIGLLALLMFGQAPRELAPAEDQGVLFGVVNTPADSTIDQVLQSTKVVHQEAMSLPEAQFTFQITFPNQGFWGVGLKPWTERERSAAQVLPDLTRAVAAIPGIQTFPTLPPALPGGGQFPVEVVISSTAEASEILSFARQIQEKAQASGLFAFPPLLDLKIDQPEAVIEIDRDKAAELGLDLQQIGQDLSAALGGDFVNRFNLAGRSYKVIPQLARVDRLNPDQLADLYIRGPNNGVVALSTIAKITHSVGPRALQKFQQLNSAKISGVAVRPLDEALRFLEGEAQRILPPGYNVDYTGESRQLRTEGRRFLPAFLLAIILILLVLAAQFNSFRDPFVILAGSVPLGMFGAMVMMFLKMPDPNLHFFTDRWTTTLNVYSQVGLVTLVGLVSKNGILIVEFANKLQEQGHGKAEAVRLAAMTRLRPILMTSAATICGHFPLTLVTGPGAAARNSIGLVLVAGMLIGTVFTLYFVPNIYLLIAKDRSAAAKVPMPAGALQPQKA